MARLLETVPAKYARVGELADPLSLSLSSQECKFESCLAYQLGDIMTEQEALEKLRLLVATEKETYDTEIFHVNADQLVAEVLHSLGYEQFAKEYSEIDVWYA